MKDFVLNQPNLDKIEDIFSTLGGKFVIPPSEMKNILKRVKCFLFDWDGVFHAGKKEENSIGGFSEIDSMGINLLRYGYWLINNELPYIGIITGEENEPAKNFAYREHFSSVYLGINDKRRALEHICDTIKITPNQMCCMFDDVNDISMSQDCGLKIQVRRDASPLFMCLSLDNKFCDYITAYTGGDSAIREVCELLLGLMGVYEKTVERRIRYDNTYMSYWEIRNKIIPKYFSITDNKIYLIEENI